MATTPPRHVPGPPPLGADLATCRAWVAALPIEMRERLAPMFQPSALRRARLAERDEMLFRMALGRQGDATAIAEAIFRELSRYAGSVWRRSDCDRETPSNPDHAVMHRILRLNDGEVPAIRTLRRPFAAVAKKTGGNGHG